MAYVAIITYILYTHHHYRGHRGAAAPGPVQGHVRRGLLHGEAVRCHGLQGPKKSAVRRSVGTTQNPHGNAEKLRKIR